MNTQIKAFAKDDEKIRKCDWCGKKKKIKSGYLLGKYKSKEWFICIKCNVKHDVV